MRLLRKELYLDSCPVLYACKTFTPEILTRDFEVRGGAWHTEDGWLVGENRGNFPGMVISKAAYYENMLLDVVASTVPPCTHDINVMWNGSWVEATNTRGVAYVAGLEGWWNGKVGFEKSPDYKLNAATQLFSFEPGRAYHLQAGSIDGHVFVLVDGRLVLETTDPDPIDVKKHGRFGFEAYCAKVRFTDLKICRVAYEPIEEHYEPEF